MDFDIKSYVLFELLQKEPKILFFFFNSDSTVNGVYFCTENITNCLIFSSYLPTYRTLIFLTAAALNF